MQGIVGLTGCSDLLRGNAVGDVGNELARYV